MSNVQPRYDMEPVLRRFPGASVVEIAHRTGVCLKQLQRWMVKGVTFWGADRIATRMGLVPAMLWPEWERYEPSPVVIDWASRRREQERARLAEAARLKATLAKDRDVDHEPLRAPGDFRFSRPKAVAVKEREEDDLVFIYPQWLASSPNPPDSPPRREECRCACSATDEFGRPITIGRCGPTCERVP